MNILIINEYSAPGQNCPLSRPVYLAREWVRQGHKVTILCSSFSHLSFKQPVVDGPLTFLEENGVGFCFVRLPSYVGNGFGRIRNMLLFAARIRRHADFLLGQTKPELVISASVHGLDSYPACYMARKAGGRYVRDLRDLWPLTLVELGGKGRLHPFVVLLQHAENFSYSKAQAVVTTLSHSLAHMEKHGLDRSKWKFIPQGIGEVTTTAPLPEGHLELLRRRRAEGIFLIGYAGGHGLANALDTLIEAASMLDGKRFGFVFMGQGPRKAALQAEAARRKLQHIDFLDPVSRSQVPAFLKEIDVAYIGWQKRDIYRYGVSPNKLMDYMLGGKPIVHACDFTPDLVEQYGCGIRVPAESASEVAQAMLSLSGLSKSELENMGMKGKEAVLKRHNYEVLASEYLKVLGY